MTVYENLCRLKDEYPNLMVTNVNCANKESGNDVFLYDLRQPKRGKRLAEIHYKPTKCIYHLVFPKVMCTPSEIEEMEHNNYNTPVKGVIKRQLSEEELLEFVRTKLNKTDIVK